MENEGASPLTPQVRNTCMGVDICTSRKEAPIMTGSLLVAVITPIAAFIAMACWLGMVFWAESHPGWKAHHAAQESQFPGEGITLADALRGDEPAPPRQETKAA